MKEEIQSRDEKYEVLFGNCHFANIPGFSPWVDTQQISNQEIGSWRWGYNVLVMRHDRPPWLLGKALLTPPPPQREFEMENQRVKTEVGQLQLDFEARTGASAAKSAEELKVGWSWSGDNLGLRWNNKASWQQIHEHRGALTEKHEFYFYLFFRLKEKPSKRNLKLFVLKMRRWFSFTLWVLTLFLKPKLFWFWYEYELSTLYNQSL